jgi:aspartyl-tRNA synthetase
MNPGTFYALPQSPQLFKQLLMVGGMDKYFQIVKCFRDEELRADRQPEFTQIDCEMSFVEQEDVMQMFEGLARHVFKEVKGVDLPPFPLMSYDHAMKFYGIDKPDLRFEMKFVEITELAKGKGFKLFDDADIVVGIKAENVAEDYSRAKLNEITELAKSGDVGAGGLIWVKVMKDGSVQSTIGKFFNDADLKGWAAKFEAKPNDLLLIFAGLNAHEKTRIALGRFRNAMGTRLGLRKPDNYRCLWVVDFPLLEWNEDDKRWNAAHHPFTSPYRADIHLLETDPGAVRARAYDMVINGVEVGGGSIRIHDRPTQELMLKHLGFTKESAEEQFGFLMKAFEYGAPPHGGLAFGMDRLTSLIGEFESIRECMAFPKNNQGRDTMIEAPSTITKEQLEELHIAVVVKEKKAAAATEEKK